MTLLKAILHNIGVAIVSFLIGYAGVFSDRVFSIQEFHSTSAVVAGWFLLGAGFFLRVWATDYFYRAKIRVIDLHTQGSLITDGPFRLSRNPLYLGGNVFMFFGVGLVLGSLSMLIFTALHLIGMHLFIRREERQLEARFGDEWRAYKARVRRWL